MTAVVKKADSGMMRSAIFRLEDFIKSIPGNGIEESGIEHVHHFAPGIYAREMIVPADVLMTGAVHKTEHISIFLEGTMIVPDGNGGSKEISGPLIELARPGIKRVGYVTERVRWITVHPTEETDVDVILKQIVTFDPVEAEQIAKQHNLIDDCSKIHYDNDRFIASFLEDRK